MNSLDFMTGNPQLGLLLGRLRYFDGGERYAQGTAGFDGLLVSQCAPASPKSLPEPRSTLLCIVSVPAHMIPTDMLQFVAPFKGSVHFLRILRPCSPARTPTEYMVLVQMEHQECADDFFLEYNWKLFTSLEDTRCHMVFVSSITFDIHGDGGAEDGVVQAGDGGRGLTKPSAAPRGDHRKGSMPPHSASVCFAAHAVGPRAAAAAWTYDAATCVICMEKMENRVLTTVCNHSFHVDCLLKWQDSPCPVCRFHHNSGTEESTCLDCGTTDNLWVCLICGHVQCGPRQADHMKQHYTDTLHAYALDIETQQVWDFAGDGFVHRLIHNKADGKVVEIPDPRQTSEERPQVPVRLSDVQEEQAVHGKLEGLAYQYNTLLTSQLDEQRQFYEKQMNRILEEQEKRSRESKAQHLTGDELISALRQKKRQLEQKCLSTSERLKKTQREAGFIRELNESLEANQAQWDERLGLAEAELAESERTREEWVPQLEQKVAQLMLRLDGGGAPGASAYEEADQKAEAIVALAEESKGSDAHVHARDKDPASPGACLSDVMAGGDEFAGAISAGQANGRKKGRRRRSGGK